MESRQGRCARRRSRRLLSDEWAIRPYELPTRGTGPDRDLRVFCPKVAEARTSRLLRIALLDDPSDLRAIHPKVARLSNLSREKRPGKLIVPARCKRRPSALGSNHLLLVMSLVRLSKGSDREGCAVALDFRVERPRRREYGLPMDLLLRHCERE